MKISVGCKDEIQNVETTKRRSTTRRIPTKIRRIIYDHSTTTTTTNNYRQEKQEENIYSVKKAIKGSKNGTTQKQISFFCLAMPFMILIYSISWHILELPCYGNPDAMQ